MSLQKYCSLKILHADLADPTHQTLCFLCGVHRDLLVHAPPLATRGGGTQGVRNVLLGGGADNSTVWVGDVGPFVVNGEEGGRGIHWYSFSYHGESSEADKRQDMEDAWGGRRTKGSGNLVGRDLNRKTTGNCGSVGGATSFI